MSSDQQDSCIKIPLSADQSLFDMTLQSSREGTHNDRALGDSCVDSSPYPALRGFLSLGPQLDCPEYHLVDYPQTSFF